MLDDTLNCSWIAADDKVPDRIVVVVLSTLNAAPPVQRTLDRLPYEAESKFIDRVMYFAKQDARPYGLCHHAELHCKYGADASGNVNDHIANLERLLWYSATNDKSCQVRAQALAALSRLFGGAHEVSQ